MVTKIINIEETVQEIIKTIGEAPVAEGASKDNIVLHGVQCRLARVHGEIARFLMEEQNLGTPLVPVFNGLMAAIGIASLNVLTGKSKETLEDVAGERLAFPDDKAHSAIHIAVDRLSAILHANLASVRSSTSSDAEFHTVSSGVVPFKRKDVGDA